MIGKKHADLSCMVFVCDRRIDKKDFETDNEFHDEPSAEATKRVWLRRKMPTKVFDGISRCNIRFFPTKTVMGKSLSNRCAKKSRTWTKALSQIALLHGLAGMLCAASAFADEAADVSKLLRANQYGPALAKADAFLAQKPRDAQMRFLKGVILTEQNKAGEAIAIFVRLTEDYPDLPEPYNNLAVLYAADGQYEKARQALDKAIKTNPSYATAYENLGDIHAKLASQAYDKALQLESGNASAKSKLTLVRSLVSYSSPGTAARPANPPVASSQIAAAAPKSAAAVSTPPAVAAIPTAPAIPTHPAQKPAPVVVAKLEPKKPEPRMPVKPAVQPSSKGEYDAVSAAVNGWARAWSAKDVKAYLNYYAPNFETPRGVSRKAWADERQARIAGKGRISVKVESPQIVFDGDKATVKFRQSYVSDRLSANSRKTLVLEKRHGKWQIQQERTGS